MSQEEYLHQDDEVGVTRRVVATDRIVGSDAVSESTENGRFRVALHRDLIGNVVRSEDLDGTETEYAYDAANRLRFMTLPDGTTIRTTYDALGRIASQSRSQDGPRAISSVRTISAMSMTR
jgi:YD repeat-containing protein